MVKCKFLKKKILPFLGILLFWKILQILEGFTFLVDFTFSWKILPFLEDLLF